MANMANIKYFQYIYIYIFIWLLIITKQLYLSSQLSWAHSEEWLVYHSNTHSMPSKQTCKLISLSWNNHASLYWRPKDGEDSTMGSAWIWLELWLNKAIVGHSPSPCNLSSGIYCPIRLSLSGNQSLGLLYLFASW